MAENKDFQSQAELEETIAQRRIDLETTLEALAYEAQPSVQAAHIVDDVKERTQQAKQFVVDTFQGALGGNPQDIKRALAITGTAVGVTVLLATQLTRRARAARQQRKATRQWKRFTRQLGRVTPPNYLTVE